MLNLCGAQVVRGKSWWTSWLYILNIWSTLNRALKWGNEACKPQWTWVIVWNVFDVIYPRCNREPTKTHCIKLGAQSGFTVSCLEGSVLFFSCCFLFSFFQHFFLCLSLSVSIHCHSKKCCMWLSGFFFYFIFLVASCSLRQLLDGIYYFILYLNVQQKLCYTLLTNKQTNKLW